MKIKHILLIGITAILTIILVRNNEQMDIQILWMQLKISKLLVLGSVFIVGLIVGLLWAAGMAKREKDEQNEANKLSEEDREFLES